MNIRDYIGEGTEFNKKEALEVKRPKEGLNKELFAQTLPI